MILDKQNGWLRYFTVFVRIAMAFGFVIAGMVKIMGERFAGGLSSITRWALPRSFLAYR